MLEPPNLDLVRVLTRPETIKAVGQTFLFGNAVGVAKRKGKLEQDEIELLKDFLHRFGWTLEPLIFHEDGIAYAHCQLPALRSAGT